MNKSRLLISVDSKFLTPCQVLLYSLMKNSPEFPELYVQILAHDEVIANDPIIQYFANEITTHERLSSKAGYTGRLGESSYAKIVGFLPSAFQRTVCLDTDILCLGSINRLVQPGDDVLRIVQNIKVRRPYGTFPEFNCGVLSISPSIQSESLFTRMTNTPLTDTYATFLAEQPLINLFAFKEKWNLTFLPTKYNMSFNLLHRKPRRLWPDPFVDLRLLHYMGTIKPWDRPLNHSPAVKRWHEYAQNCTDWWETKRSELC